MAGIETRVEISFVLFPPYAVQDPIQQPHGEGMRGPTGLGGNANGTSVGVEDSQIGITGFVIRPGEELDEVRFRPSIRTRHARYPVRAVWMLGSGRTFHGKGCVAAHDEFFCNTHDRLHVGLRFTSPDTI